MPQAPSYTKSPALLHPRRAARRRIALRGSPDHRLPTRPQTARSRRAPDKTCYHWRQALDQHHNAVLVRMESIRLIELRFHRNTFEKEWVKRHIMDLSKLGKDPVKFGLVFRSPIGGREHADQ